MNANECDDIVRLVIGRAFVVSNLLGAGFVEKIYENALAIELREAGSSVRQQHGITVHYKGTIIGSYAADLLIEDAVLVELKAVRALEIAHHTQCLNYLKATNISLCLLINFGNPRAQIKRFANTL